jgi:hypothetical protein
MSPSSHRPEGGTPADEGMPVYRAVLVLDAEDYGSATSAQQSRITAEIVDVIGAAFARAGLAADWDARLFRERAHTGDGYFVGLPPERLPRLLDPFLRVLQQELCDRDATRPVREARLRLRASIHVGPLLANGAGKPMTETHRLVESDDLRQALRDSDPEVTFLAVIVSQHVFEEWVRAGHTSLAPSQFRKVSVRVKQLAEDGYVYVPEPSVRKQAAPEAARTRRARDPREVLVQNNDGNLFIGPTTVHGPVVSGGQRNYYDSRPEDEHTGS